MSVIYIHYVDDFLTTSPPDSPICSNNLNSIPQWPGKSLILEFHLTPNALMELFTDTSSKDGWEAYWAGRWISDHWYTVQGKQVLPGRSSLLLSLPLTHGALTGNLEKS